MTSQTNKPLDLAVLISGSGRTLENLIGEIRSGRVHARIAVVLSSKRDIRGNEIAAKAGLPLEIVPRKEIKDEIAFQKEVNRSLKKYQFDLIVLAGFLSRLEILPEWNRRVINVHPALLPKFGGKGFYGDKVHAAVIAAREKESGCSIHFVDAEYDHGEVIAQKRVPVLPGDDVHSLADRVFQAEQQLYPEVVQMFATGRQRFG